MKVVLVDTNWKQFLPLTFTKPVSGLRIGILTLKEKWEHWLQLDSYAVSEDFLNPYFFKEFDGDAIIINSKVLPDAELVKKIQALESKQILTHNGTWVAIKSDVGFSAKSWEGLSATIYTNQITIIENWWDLYKKNGQQIENDFQFLTQKKKSLPLSATNTVIGDENKIFLEKDVYLEGCILNTLEGSIYFGKNTQVMEGSMIRGGFSALNDCKIKMGAKIYGPTSIGPNCRLAGEVKNVIIQGNTNKSHDGYLGNAVLGEWINLGADTNASNLKNTFSEAKVWSYQNNAFENSNENFIGCCIGDFSKTGINTMLNTGTTVGVNSNVFGANFPNKYIPSFSWGNTETYDFEKAWQVNNQIAEMGGKKLPQYLKNILQHVWDIDRPNEKTEIS